MKYYSIGEFSKLIGKSQQTLRLWHKKNIFVPNHITEGGTRYYSHQQYLDFLKLKRDHKVKKILKEMINSC